MKTLTAIWVALLVGTSLQPLRPAATSDLHQMHRPFHFIAFGLTALLFWRLFAVSPGSSLPPRRSLRRAAVTATLTTIALGLSIELLQHLIYHAPIEWWDVRDDSVGAIAAILLGETVRAVRQPVRRDT